MVDNDNISSAKEQERIVSWNNGILLREDNIWSHKPENHTTRTSETLVLNCPAQSLNFGLELLWVLRNSWVTTCPMMVGYKINSAVFPLPLIEAIGRKI